MSDADAAASAPAESVMPFFGAEFDLPSVPGPARSYVIASTPRSGSMLLCDLLHATGVLGVPAEYFNQVHMMPAMARRLGLELPVGMGCYVAALRQRRTTANGVFAAKLHFHQAWALISQPAFRSYLGHSRFVWLRRRDQVAQASSLAIALRTGRWFRLRDQAVPDEEGREVVDIRALFEAFGQLRAEDGFWQMFFEVNRIQPLELTYEAMREDPAAAVAAIGRLVGVDPGPVPNLDASRFAPSRAGRTELWRQGLVKMLRVVEEQPKG